MAGILDHLNAQATAALPVVAGAPVNTAAVVAVVAPVNTAAVVAAPVVAAPVVAPAVGVAVAPVVAGAPVVAAVSLGGGNALNNALMEALQTASTGSRRNNMPPGVGVFLLKSCKFVITEGGKYKISAFTMYCLYGIKDANGIAFGTQGYTGPVPGDSYEVAIFQDISPKYSKINMGNNLRVVRVCMGWTEDYMKQYQATPEGNQILLGLLSGMFCCDPLTLAPTQQECAFSNQVAVEMACVVTRKEEKGSDGKVVYDEHQQKKMKVKEYQNWNEKVPLATVAQTIGDAAVIAAWGSKEAFEAAYTQEQEAAAQ